MYLCILDQDGTIVLHRRIPCRREAFLQAVAPYGEDLAICVECIFCWYWLADLCVEHGIHVVLAHALYLKAIHGGKSKNDRIDSEKLAMLLRGGAIPMSYVYPAEMRSTRDLLQPPPLFLPATGRAPHPCPEHLPPVQPAATHRGTHRPRQEPRRPRRCL